MQNHFDKYCFAGKKQVRFRLGIGSDDVVGHEVVQTATGF
jgi:hypothetical protein